MRDIHNGLKAVQTPAPKVTVETPYGAPVDLKGFAALEHIVSVRTAGYPLLGSLSIASVIAASPVCAPCADVAPAPAVSR